MQTIISIILTICSFTQRLQMIQNELNYYLQRHSVQDVMFYEKGNVLLRIYTVVLSLGIFRPIQ